MGFGKDDTWWTDFEGGYSSSIWWVLEVLFVFLCYLQAFLLPWVSESLGVMFFKRNMCGDERRCMELLPLCVAAEN
jgi:hypothetical protein